MTNFRIPLETLKNLIIEAATYNQLNASMKNDYERIRNEIMRHVED